MLRLMRHNVLLDMKVVDTPFNIQVDVIKLAIRQHCNTSQIES